MSENVFHVSITRLTSASASNVWDRLKAYDWFLKSPNVRSLEKSPIECNRRKAKWSVWLKGFDLTWEEEQLIFDAEHRMTFNQTAGMFLLYRGQWVVTEVAKETTEIALTIDVDTGMPYLTPIMNPVVGAAFADLGNEMIAGV